MNPTITLASLSSTALAGYLVSGPLLSLHAAWLGSQFDALDAIFLTAGLLEMLAGLYALLTVGAIYIRKEQA